MLYLIKSQGKEKSLIKIGYTKDLEQRIKTYKIHNPLVEIIDSFEGTMKEEQLLHNILKKYIIYNEWMEYDPKIINTWKTYKILFSELNNLYKDQIEMLKNKNKKLQKYLLEYDNVVTKLSEINDILLESKI